jgi:hypothetical protein
MKAMELRREHRYDSAQIMRQILNSAQQQLKARKTSEPKPRAVPEPLPTSQPTIKPLHVPEVSSDPLADQAADKIAADLKAAQEKERAELRRKEMEADLERQRKEAERIKAAEVAAAEKAAEEAKKAAAAEVSEDQFLLEVEPVKTADDNFEWSIDVSEEPSRREREVKAFSASDGDIDFNIEASSGPNIKVIAAGVGSLVIVVAILGWVFMGGSSPSNSSQAQAPQQQRSQEQAPASSFAEPNAANTSTEQAPLISETVTVDAGPESPAAKQKKTPTPSKSPAKKKVTVDDLINDN